MLNYYTSKQGENLEKRVAAVEEGGGGGGSGYVELATLVADEDGYIYFNYDTPIDVNSMIVFHDLDREGNSIIGVKAVTSHNPSSPDTKALRPGIFTERLFIEGQGFSGFVPTFFLPEDLEDEDADEYVYLDINEVQNDTYKLDLEIDKSNYRYSPGDHIKVYAKLADKYNAIYLSRSDL